MILRRLTDAFRKQDWFTVFIETMIVVLGVFLGLQASNWNEARNDRSDASQYRERLVADMELSVSRNQDQIDYSRRQLEQLDLALTALESCQLAAEDEGRFAAGLYNMGKFDLPTMVMGTIDELNATGKFPLIGDPELRKAITETVRIHQTTFSIDPQITARSVPSVNYVRARVRFVLDEHFNRPSTIGPDKVVYDFDALCADPFFINAVATVREMTIATIALNQEIRDRQDALLGTLEAGQ
ncbi:MAG: hypothetical protein KDA53_04360 [Hyphomonas sp.]|nr:hypothetical protein [Hyphomonas sp.]